MFELQRDYVQPRIRFGSWLRAVLLLTLATPASAAMSGTAACGDIDNGANGPYDYRNQRERLPVVETHHFTAKVEALVGGQSTYQVGSDLDFLLRAFPNHPRALVATMRWGEKLKTATPPDMPYSVECYFDRALRFRPDDNVVRMIYATFLSRNQRQEESVRQIDLVAARAADSAFTHYNAGLLYAELKQYDKAVVQAHAAIALGFARTELREQLKAVGKWSDPVQVSEPAASSASAGKPL